MTEKSVLKRISCLAICVILAACGSNDGGTVDDDPDTGILDVASDTADAGVDTARDTGTLGDTADVGSVDTPDPGLDPGERCDEDDGSARDERRAHADDFGDGAARE